MSESELLPVSSESYSNLQKNLAPSKESLLEVSQTETGWLDETARKQIFQRLWEVIVSQLMGRRIRGSMPGPT